MSLPKLSWSLAFLLSTTLSAQVYVTIASSPPNAGFTVSGTGCSPGAYATPQPLSWTPGSNCIVTFTTPQYPAVGTQFVFTGWQDGSTSNPRTIVAPFQAASYTATLNTLYFLSTVANPSAGGSVSGGGWYAPNSTVNLTATAASGYKFVNWSGVATANGTSATILITSATTVTANFAPGLPAPSTSYLVTQILGPGNTGTSLNNYGQVTARTNLANPSAPSRAILWTPNAANTNSGTAIDLGSLTVNGTPAVVPAQVNDQGQVVGTISILPGSTSLPFLWQPSSPNATSGTMTAFLGSPPAVSAGATGINNFGQIIGFNGSAWFVWTPSTANSTTGTLNTDSRLAAPKSIDNFGQVAINAGDSANPKPMLFTPATANGADGAFTSIPGAQSTELNHIVAINSNGTVLMDYGGPCLSACADYGRLFTPSSPNSSTGTTTAIPIPAGFQSLIPEALNSSGQVVGALDKNPFLYAGGTVYDLSQLSSLLKGADAHTINDKGQILLNGQDGAVYLATPQVLPPSAMPPSPQFGTTANQSMVFTFTDPKGWQDLGVVNILINNFIDGRGACYLAYSVPASTLYLVNDAGLAQGPYAGGIVLGNSGTIQNSQCSVGLTSATGNGNTLTLMLSVNFTPAFAGNRIIFLAAGNTAQVNSGWMPLGVWIVPGSSPTTTTSVVGMTPTSGTGFGPSTYTFNFSDTKGYRDIGVANILVNSSLDGRHACYLAFIWSVSGIYIVADFGGLVANSLAVPGSLSNSQCTVSWGNNPFTGSGNNLTLTLNIGFNAGFGPDLVFYLAARDTKEGNNTGWQASATWIAQ